VQYLFSSHKKIRYNKIKNILRAIKNKKIKNDVWLRIDGAILHVASHNIKSAKKLLNMARDIGFRRSGIISLGKNRIVMELISTENIEAIVSKKGKLVIDEDYFKVLIMEGNKKLEKTWEKIDKLDKKIR
jgi:tRNA wybutosine-synthesizing protein 3